MGVVEPGILALANSTSDKNANILIIGTNATINSRAYEKPLLSNQYCNISARATGLFVPIVEEGLYNGEVLQSTMHHYFKDLEHPDAIILGCTHFPLISDAISEYFKVNTQLIHSGEAIVEYLEHHYDFTKKFKNTELKLFASENPEALRAVAKKWLDL